MRTCPNCGEENPERFRLCGFCGTPLAPALPPQEVRKTVSIVFSDLKGSTDLGEKLDSEALREVMSRYFDEMRAVLEHHGGTVEKYIGDAIMAVFGLPRLHEDDALRAVRAAHAMTEALATVNEELDRRWGVRLTNRTGVNTGEVVAGDPTTGQRLVTGDAVNTAARLEQAAPANEVLIGDSTYRLVRGRVQVEAVEPLELKGKAERVPAYRLLGVREVDEATHGYEGVLVGREPELEELRSAFDAAVGGRRCRAVTLVAEAGVGKSRLIDEFAATVDGEAEVMRGRCLSYGRGITFWPIVEIVRHAAGIREDDGPERARERVRELLGHEAAEAAEPVAAAIGLSDVEYPVEELFLGIRRLFETCARRRPLVLLFEDVHWAETTFLDLVERIAGSSTDAPILLLCTARPELDEQRPGWQPCPDAARIDLGALSPEQSALVVQSLLGDSSVAEEVTARVVDAAEGNPLFVEQLLSMLVDDGLLQREDGGWRFAGDLDRVAVPPTINALLAARLDLLSAEERAVIEPASVIGVGFVRPAVEALVPDAVRDGVATHLDALVRKRLIRAGENGDAGISFRFHHILVRDAAYQGLLKRTRATLHERYADWADRMNRDRDRTMEYEEIQGYHLEQAHGYLSELGPLDEHGIDLGARGGVMLGSAGGRAFGRGDMPAAANLLRRAAALFPEGDRRRLELLPDLGEAMMETGEYAWAQVYLDDAVAGAVALGDTRLEADAVMTHLLARHHVVEDLEAWSDEILREAQRLVPLLEAEEAHAELAKAWRLVGFVHGSVCRWGEQVAAVREALVHATAAAERRLQARLTAELAMGLCDGPTPVSAAIAELERALGRDLGDRQSEALVLCSLARLKAFDGEFQEARNLILRAARLRDELGGNLVAPVTSLYSSQVEVLAGDPAAAERDLRRDYEKLTRMGERYVLPLVGALLAQAVWALGRDDEAAELAAEAAAAADEQDVETQALLRSVEAKLLARRREAEEALRLAREAVDLLSQTDSPITQATALLDFAEVAEAVGAAEAARQALGEALALLESKEVAHAAERVSAALEEAAETVRQVS
jgi:class 3 adenylate cyclase/tetratricopeptide (TPR) repeat protein